jgi:hypothetical protein
MLPDELAEKQVILGCAASAKNQYLTTMLGINIGALDSVVVYLVEKLCHRCLLEIPALAGSQYQTDTPTGKERVAELETWASRLAIYTFQERVRKAQVQADFIGHAPGAAAAATPSDDTLVYTGGPPATPVIKKAAEKPPGNSAPKNAQSSPSGRERDSGAPAKSPRASPPPRQSQPQQRPKAKTPPSSQDRAGRQDTQDDRRQQTGGNSSSRGRSGQFHQTGQRNHRSPDQSSQPRQSQRSRSRSRSRDKTPPPSGGKRPHHRTGSTHSSSNSFAHTRKQQKGRR